MSESSRYCPRCDTKSLSGFCGEMVKRIDGKPHATLEQWDKEHTVPKMAVVNIANIGG